MSHKVVGLTVRMRELLQFINRYEDERGVFPSIREMAKGVGLASTSGVHRMLTALEERGYIKRLPTKARAIAVLNSPEQGRAA